MLTVLLNCEIKLLVAQPTNPPFFACICRHPVCAEAGVTSPHYLLARPVPLLYGSQLS